MTPVAIMREPSRSYVYGGEKISIAKARRQHQRLRGIYRRHGYKVELLPPAPMYSAGVFVQDTVFLARGQALLTNCMSSWRTREARYLGQLCRVLRRYVDVVGQMGLPAELDTGEVVKTDTEYLVGASKKTAYGGVRQIRKKLDLDLPLRTVKRVDDGLCHLGSGLSYLGDDHLLAVEDLRGYRFLDRYNIVWVPPEEEDIGGNVVTLADGCIIAPVNAPETVALLRDMGRDVETVDTSEYTKADGHISCLSINIQ